MNEKPNFESQIKDLTKKLEIPQITLLQIKGLTSERQELIDSINMYYQEKQQKEGKELNKDKEEIETINKLVSEFDRETNVKIFSFVDKWETKDFTPSDRELEYLQKVLNSIWKNKEIVKVRKEHKFYEEDKKFAEQTDKLEQNTELANSYHDKLLFLISQHYKEKSETSSSVSEEKKNPTVLPWTLAIIFGIMTVILAGIAGFLFYKQRKIKRFKV